MAKVRTLRETVDLCVQTIRNRLGVRTQTEEVDLEPRHCAGRPMMRAEALAMRGAHAIDEPPFDVAPRGGA